MATQDRTKAQARAAEEVSANPASPQVFNDPPAPKWVNDGDPTIKTLLDFRYYGRNSRSSAASDYTVAQWHALEDAMSRVVVEAGKDPSDPSSFFIAELDELVNLRFTEGYDFKTYTSEVILSVGLDAYRAGVEAGMAQAKQPETPVLNLAEIAAIAVSDHDCPGCHS